MFDGLLRHLKIMKESWSQVSDDHKKNEKHIHEEFLPAALEIVEKPASRGGRYLMWVLIVLFIVAVIWAIYGKTDIVAIAQGKLIPKGYVKTVQTSEGGVITRIHARNGDRVKKGDLLVELDTTDADTNKKQASDRLIAAELDLAHWKGLLAYIDTNKPEFKPPKDSPEEKIATERELIAGQIAEHEAKVDTLLKQRLEKDAEVDVAKSRLAQTREILPILKKKLTAYDELREKGISAEVQYLDIKRQYIEQAQQLGIERKNIARAKAAIKSIDSDIVTTKAEFRAMILNNISKQENQVVLRRGDLIKAKQQDKEHKVAAPVAGTIQQSKLTTLGGVVKPAEPLMIIVPDDVELIFEGKILNRDIGYVNQGDKVQVKLEAFPYTKFGVINGHIARLSSDAVADKKLGLVYNTLVKIEAQAVNVGAKSVNLTPGMQGSAEIKTGDRRLIEFFLSPLLKLKGETFKER
ncbi:Hemolysin secretion protein D, chromosomal [BD1-7 clade bacterium]|uniref:Membrane fusion protein (MFP) family protein n=1 Tax=BD1-7 clade bacterium TaxID=2029982 RepID=A0A5S9QHQ0_9GAMM|nr:Hemolysin secretion protein D, chromosomal [BD1-7 clade bacterium]CAA0117110.1 Hemolysin secretion protein D, chromosomal [BD1-7 clade bacterium]